MSRQKPELNSENSNQEPKANYNSSEIEILNFPECVRTRPGMYVADTDNRGLHQLVWEIVDNAIDEHLAGFCSHVELTLERDGSIEVTDNGRGIPTDVVSGTAKSGVEVVFTVLHSGSKFKSSAYKFSGGLHGVGASVVNALSSAMTVEVFRDGKHYSQNFARGVALTALEQTAAGDTAIKTTGTRITFKPDDQIFSCVDSETPVPGLNWETITDRLRQLAFLSPGLSITACDRRNPGQPVIETFCFQHGLSQYVQHLNYGASVINPEPILIDFTSAAATVQGALQWTGRSGQQLYTFANNICTADGGAHERGLKLALTNAINAYAHDKRLVRKNDTLNFEDVADGLTAVLSVKLSDPQFEGQTKARLNNKALQPLIASFAADQLLRWLALNPATAKEIINRALQARQLRLNAAAAKEKVSSKSVLFDSGLPGKLADCTSDEPAGCEIFLVEGDSAGGSAKQARNRHFQAILPLRGKILNVERVSAKTMNANAEISAIVQALGLHWTSAQGASIKPNKNSAMLDLTRLRYHKVVIMTDADVDGSHIRTLLL
ncbi:MAG: DNA gyrase/topoisomerase IV subunit B, partial [Terriglobales bacterium]